MTCIVAVKDGENLVFGGDSAANSPPTTEIYTVTTPKIFRCGEYLVGYTLSFRAGQVVRHGVAWPDPPADGTQDLESFLVQEVVPRLRQALREAGALKTTEGVERGAHFLIGLRGQLFSVGVDFSAVGTAEPYMAIGSGRHHAYGALHALAASPISAEERVTRALEAAAHFTYNVQQPFLVISSR